VTTSEEIGARIRIVRSEMSLSQKAMAELAGMSLRTWQGIEQGRNVPSGEPLLRFEPVGYNPGWILTGLGPKKLDAKPEPTNSDLVTFVEILPDIAATIEAAYRESNARLREFELVNLSAHWLGEIQKMARNIGDRQELLSLLPWVSAQVKRDIANANAGLSKRAASD